MHNDSDSTLSSLFLQNAIGAREVARFEFTSWMEPVEYRDDVINALSAFIAKDKFQNLFQNFFLDHALEFTDDSEHALRYYELYNIFHDKFDQQLGDFCDELNISQGELVKRCRAAAADDPAARHFIDVINASADYEVFVKLMRLMRPQAAQRLMRTAEEKQESWERPSSKSLGAEYEEWSDDKTYRSSDSFRAECKLEELREAEAKGSGAAKR